MKQIKPVHDDLAPKQLQRPYENHIKYSFHILESVRDPHIANLEHMCAVETTKTIFFNEIPLKWKAIEQFCNFNSARRNETAAKNVIAINSRKIIESMISI